MTIQVIENEDNTFTISWDENDPNEKIFNDFKEEDFINLIQNYLNTLQESGVLDDIGGEEVLEESVNQITHYIEQTAEEVEQDIQTLKDFIEEDEEDRRPRLFF